MKFPTQTKTSKPASVSRSSFQRNHMCVINGERRTYNLCLSLIKDEGRVGCNFLLTGQRSRLMMSVHRFDAVSQEGTRSGEKRLARGKLQKLFAVCPSALIVCTHVSVGFACEDTLKPWPQFYRFSGSRPFTEVLIKMNRHLHSISTFVINTFFFGGGIFIPPDTTTAILNFSVYCTRLYFIVGSLSGLRDARGKWYEMGDCWFHSHAQTHPATEKRQTIRWMAGSSPGGLFTCDRDGVHWNLWTFIISKHLFFFFWRGE